jgi:GTP cyclohydrolase I
VADMTYPYKKNTLHNDEKLQIIQDHFFGIMETLGLDMSNDSLKETPQRVAKMFVHEVFSGLDESHKPHIAVFDNAFNYDEMILIKDIKVFSFCEHHFLPFTGKAYVGYIPNKKVIGLSKISRIVDFYARKPQIQERLTEEIFTHLSEILETDSLIIVINAVHHCMVMR